MSTQCALQTRVDLAGFALPLSATQVQCVSTGCLQSVGGADSPLAPGPGQPCAIKVGFVVSSKITGLDAPLLCLRTAAYITSGSPLCPISYLIWRRTLWALSEQEEKGAHRRRQQPQPGPGLRKKVPLCPQRSGWASGASSNDPLAPLASAGGSTLHIPKAPLGQPLLPTLVSESLDSLPSALNPSLSSLPHWSLAFPETIQIGTSAIPFPQTEQSLP